MVIDTFLDRRSAFYFADVARGSKGDALITGDGGDYNKPWDGIWGGQVLIDSQGWTREMAIPFKTLAFAEVRRPRASTSIARSTARTRSTAGPARRRTPRSSRSRAPGT
ncbi:MAG: hypothetical protein IPK67_00020 [Planctomycetes bacterium]|nr:hypothetical protein [Planctomycetota bacterium]